MKQTIKLGATEAVVVDNAAGAVSLELQAFGMTLARRTLTKAQARELGDALGFASNDVPPPAPCAVRPDSTWPRECGTCELRPCGAARCPGPVQA